MTTEPNDALQQSEKPKQTESTETRITRRKFTADTKPRILAEAAACKHGELGMLLRRECICHSMLKRWQLEARGGEINALGPRKQGRKTLAPKAEAARLQRENERLQKRLEQAEAIIEIQKKLCTMLGLTPAARDL